MKKLIIIALAIVTTIIGLTSRASAQQNNGTTSLYLSCQMDCISCENKLTELLKFEKGVKDLKCDFASNTIYVKYKTGSNSTENFIKVITKKGYETKEISKEEYDNLLKSQVVDDDHHHDNEK